jgi:hypothetical protein
MIAYSPPVRDSIIIVYFGTLRPVKFHIDNQEIDIIGIQAVIFFKEKVMANN